MPVVPVPPESQEAVFRSMLVTIRNPLSRPPFFLGLELVMYVCVTLTLVHAVRARRRGETWPLFLWFSTFAYGLLIEIVSYNVVDNFTHGPFTVMFYRDRLPLYISAFYPVFIYTAATTVKRFGLGRLAEPFAIGLLLVMMDFPFDICGPVVRWWAWANDDPNIAHRWSGVPVTSYYWHLAFGGILSMLVRSLAGFVARKKSPLLAALALAFPIGLATMVLGFLAFLPFHGIKALHVSDGLIVGALISVAALITVLAKKRPMAGTERGLPAILLLWFGYHAIVAAVLAVSGALDSRALATIVTAFVVGAALHLAPRFLAPGEVRSPSPAE
jgi:hypothetical protein